MNGKERRRREKNREILAAASRVFAEEGYENASMDRVAERAGSSKRTVYNHFKSKDALFEAVIDRLLERWQRSKALPWEPERPLRDQLADFARIKVAVTRDPLTLDLLRASLAIRVSDSKALERVMAKVRAEDDGLILWLRQAKSAGALAVEDPKLAAEIFWAMANGALFWPALIGITTSETEGLIQEIVETFLARHPPKC